MTSEFTLPRASVVSSRMMTGRHGDIATRRYTSRDSSGPALVWVHGGAFVGGGLDQLESHAVAATLADGGHRVTTIDY